MKTKIGEIYPTLTSNERQEILRRASSRTKMGVNAVYRWLTGRRKPRGIYEDIMTRTINSVTGEKWDIEYTSNQGNE